MTQSTKEGKLIFWPLSRAEYERRVKVSEQNIEFGKLVNKAHQERIDNLIERLKANQ